MGEDEDEEERKEKEALLPLKLDDPRIKIFDLVSLSIEDFAQDVNVNLVVHYLDLDSEKHPKGFEISNEWSKSKFTVAKEEAKENDEDKEDTTKEKDKMIGKKRKDMADLYEKIDQMV